MYRVGDKPVGEQTYRKGPGACGWWLTVSPGSQKGHLYLRVRQVQHCQLGEGRDCAISPSALGVVYMSQCRKDKKLLESTQRRTVNIMKGLEGKMCEEQRKPLGFFRPEKRRLRKRPHDRLQLFCITSKKKKKMQIFLMASFIRSHWFLDLLTLGYEIWANRTHNNQEVFIDV